jgi:hypothetical protein
MFSGCMANFILSIFDQWGEFVFETTDISNGRDGSFRGRSMYTTVFTFYLKATLSNGKNINRFGNITLIR